VAKPKKGEIMIRIENVKKVYDTGKVQVEALKDINLNLSSGELAAIIGPSGSGKSTLMHIIGCLDVPNNGSYFLDNQDVSKLSFDMLAKIRNKKIGFVFQNFFLLPYINAQENIEMPMIFAGADKSKRKKKSAELLELVDMADRADHKPNELSGGEQQRIAIARALANDPEIILADEPTGNLDSKTGSEIISLFLDLWKKGKTVIMITHDQNISKKCQRRIELFDGMIVRQ
jgi:putative ABC transport system ATP-binding protein